MTLLHDDICATKQGKPCNCPSAAANELALNDLLCDADKIKNSLKVLNMIKTEMPRTMGEPNFQLIYNDICEAVKILEGT